jgi:hypothetical protein
VIIKSQTPVSRVRGEVRKRENMRPCIENVIQCTNTLALMKEGVLNWKRKGIRQVGERNGVSPGSKRRVRALRRVPTGVEVPCKNARTMGT